MTGPLPRHRTDIDLSRCTEAPVHVPGSIQGHGALLALAPGPDLVVEQASANLAAFLAVETEAALGRPLADLLPEGTVAAVRALAEAGPEGAGSPGFRLLAGDGRTPLFASVHRNDACIVLELECVAAPAPDGLSDDAFAAVEAAFVRELAAAANVYEIARATVELVSEAARFDRTVIYTFLPDWTGEVVAEIKRPAATPFLGMRFPATDIPLPARRLAEASPLRVTADTLGDPVPLLPERNPRTRRPLDLTGAVLRSVAPVHLQYLRNMGVSAALNASLVVEGRLWGILSCHHDVPRLVDPPLRAVLARIAGHACTALARVVEADRVEAERQVARRLAVVEHTVSRSDNVVRQLLASDPGLLDLAAADGLAVVAGDDVACFGLTPDTALIRRLAGLTAEQPDQFLVAECLTGWEPAAEACREASAGMLAVALTIDPVVVIAAFRREVVHEVIWGGDPSRPVEVNGEQLTPRKSFEQWRETVVGHCRPWEPETIVAWQGLPAWLGTAFGGYGAAALRLVEDISQLMPPTRFDEPFLRALLNAVSGTLLVESRGADGRPHVLVTNRDFRHLFRIAPDELIGRSLEDALRAVGLTDPKIPRLCPGAVVEATILTAGRGERTIQISHRPLLRLCCNGGDRTFAAWVFEDATRSRRVEQALQSARDQAVVASRAKTEFLANMSHELRTPLNAIIGFSEIMRAELFGALGSAKYKEYVRNIQTSGEHLLAVIGEVLDISKVEAGHYVLEEQVLNLTAVIQDICVLESDQAERAGVKLMQEVAARSMLLQADERALKQILLNLLSNSFKFTPSGGMVTCRAIYLASGGIAIEVQDTGIGIPEDHLHRVLDPFIQVRDRHARKTTGTGLGLSLVRVLAELHGGRVTVNSQPNRGTAIRVSLPPWRAMPAESGAGPGGILPNRGE